ncbi:hypothetical protein MRB53_025598 [Persea americana]|uniref:Uncharacterized protein n=1 Tax=Persea americana TaxID=3435 RepID=A0ACC2LFK1_PERAE|nr:hypothetical protein MRB53_025598 [Persea americana]
MKRLGDVAREVPPAFSFTSFSSHALASKGNGDGFRCKRCQVGKMGLIGSCARGKMTIKGGARESTSATADAAHRAPPVHTASATSTHHDVTARRPPQIDHRRPSRTHSPFDSCRSPLPRVTSVALFAKRTWSPPQNTTGFVPRTAAPENNRNRVVEGHEQAFKTRENEEKKRKLPNSRIPSPFQIPLFPYLSSLRFHASISTQHQHTNKQQSNEEEEHLKLSQQEKAKRNRKI